MTPMESELPTLEQLLKALGDQTRLRILNLLRAREVCVCHIHESLGIPQPKASRHLAVLRRVGLVKTRRHGVWISYQLGEIDDPLLQRIMDAVAEGVQGFDCCLNDQQTLSAQGLRSHEGTPRACCQAAWDALRIGQASSSTCLRGRKN